MSNSRKEVKAEIKKILIKLLQKLITEPKHLK